MLTIPLYIFLFIFLAVAVICLIVFFVIIDHLAKGASLTFVSFVFTFFIFCIMMLVLYGVWFLLKDIGWSTEVFQVSIPFYGSSSPEPFFE